MAAPSSERGAFMAHTPAPPRRARAHGAAALGLDDDPVADAEAYELSGTHASPHEPGPPPPAFVAAGFDKLTAGEHAWMLSSLALVAALTTLGLLLCFPRGPMCPSSTMPTSGALWLPAAVRAAADAPAWEAIRNDVQAQREGCDANVAALLRERALQGAPSAEATASVLHGDEASWADTLLDLFWAVDWELEVRRELRTQLDGSDSLAEEEPVPIAAARARLAEVLSALVTQGTISHEAACLREDAPLLAAADFVHAQTFQRRGIQIRTATNFKQQKYNLLREENEGYSALLTELVAHRGPPLYAARTEDGAPWTGSYAVHEQEAPAARDARAATVLENITALVGYFHLDAARALDLVLAVFAAHVTHHYPFFVSLLRQSSWDAARIAAVLGFQFAHYAHPETRDDTPEELYVLAGLLLRDGIVPLETLAPYLAPSEGLASLKSRYQDALAACSASVGANALTMAAPLVDDDAPPTTAQETDMASATPQRDAPAQYVHVLRTALACGAIKIVHPILVENSWLFGAFPALTAVYLRVVKHMIAPVYRTLSLGKQAPSTALGQLLPGRGGLPRLQLTLYAPEPRASATERYVYFVNDWAREVAPCLDAEAVVQRALPFLAPVGAHLGQDLPLLQRLCRMGAAFWQHARETWLGVVRTQLLPAISLAPSDAALLYELWAMLSQLTYTERFRLYGEWKHRTYKRPELKFRQSETEREARGILRRVSSDNVRSSGRSLAKASHPNPVVFFTVVLHQIQSYDNLIEPVVETAKYLTPFEYDVFSFTLLEALSNPEKDRTKSDGTNASLWLKSLAAFSGAFYKKYPVTDCTPLLQYLVNQLKHNHVKDLIVLSELIQKMAGIEPIGELSEQQIAALTGGPLLQSEAALTYIPTPSGSVPTTILVARNAYKKGGARLLATLTASYLALPLLLLIAQQRQACVFLVPDTEVHIKSLGSTFDHVQETLFQYTHFLTSTLTADEFAALVPPPQDLCRRFGLEASVAFHIARPKLAHDVKRKEKEDGTEELKGEAKDDPAHPILHTSVSREGAPEQATETDQVDADAAQGETNHANDASGGKSPEIDAPPSATPPESTKPAASTPAEPESMDERPDSKLHPADSATADVAHAVATAEAADEAMPDGERVQTVWQPALQPVIDAVAALPGDALSALGAPFFVTFWQLSLADIMVPMDRYQQEISRLRQWIRDVDAAKDLSDSLKKSARVRLSDNIMQLTTELKEQTLAHQATRRRLLHEKQHYFRDDASPVLIAQQLISQCLHPRSLLTPIDAMFSARFLKMLHTHGTRNLPTLAVYDGVFRQHVAQTLFLATENEARNYARFLAGVLSDTQAWLDQDTYVREALGDHLPGFALSWQGMRGTRQRTSTTPLSWYAYRGLVLEWHETLCAAFRQCLESDEYMRIRNAIVVLNRVSLHFPLYEEHGKQLQGAVEHLVQHEARGDLKVLAQGLAATLRKRTSDWVDLAHFTYVVPEKPKSKPEPELGPVPPTPPVAKQEELKQAEAQPAKGTPAKDAPKPREKAVRNTPSKAQQSRGIQTRAPTKETRPERPERPERSERPERLERPERPERPEHPERPELANRAEHQDLQDRRDNRPERQDRRDTRGRNANDTRDRDVRDARVNDARSLRDARDTRDPRDLRDAREARDGRDARGRNARDGRNAREPPRNAREPRGPNPPRGDTPESREPVSLRIRGSDREARPDPHDRGEARDECDGRPRGWGRRGDARPMYAERDPRRARDNGWGNDRVESNARWERRRDDSWRAGDRREDDDRNSRKRSLADRLVESEAPSSVQASPSGTPDSKRKKTERDERMGRGDRRGDRERDRRRRRAGGDN